MGNVINSNCILCENHQKSVFEDFPRDYLEKINKIKSVNEYAAGHMIFYEGNPALAAYCILSGLVKLYKTGAGGQEITVRILSGGDIMGYRAIFASELSSLSAKTITKSVLCMIPKTDLFSLINEKPELLSPILSKLAKDSMARDEHFLSRLQETVKQRVARLLIYLTQAEYPGNRRNSIISNSLPRTEMAHIIGTAPETLSRTLSYLAEVGLIRLSRTNISIEKLEGLMNLVSGKSEIKNDIRL